MRDSRAEARCPSRNSVPVGWLSGDCAQVSSDSDNDRQRLEAIAETIEGCRPGGRYRNQACPHAREAQRCCFVKAAPITAELHSKVVLSNHLSSLPRMQPHTPI